MSIVYFLTTKTKMSVRMCVSDVLHGDIMIMINGRWRKSCAKQAPEGCPRTSVKTDGCHAGPQVLQVIRPPLVQISGFATGNVM